MRERLGEHGRAQLDQAIERATEALFLLQRADGSWDARSDVGPASTANVLVALAYVGVLTEEERRDGTRWLRSQQRADGSFLPYPYATEGDLSVTAQCWAALSLADDDAGRDAAQRAKDFVMARGGATAVVGLMSSGDVGAIFLGLAGLLPASELPSAPLLWSLCDEIVEFLATKVHFGIVMGSLELGLIQGALANGRSNPGWVGEKERQHALALLGLFQNPDGSWNGNTVQTSTALAALYAAGLEPSDERVMRTVAWMRTRVVRDASGLWFDVFASDVWTTAFQLRALLASGVSRADPRIVRALEWLLSRQLDVPQPWPDQRRPREPKTGGFPFQTGNVTMADTDDTGVVLTSLGLARTPGRDGRPLDAALAERIRIATERALTWLAAMQNDDGGWGAFVWGVPKDRPPGPLFLTPIDVPPEEPLVALLALVFPRPELGDPSTEDLTGRVLHGLGSSGRRVEALGGDRVALGGLEFARRMQNEAGAWWARWLTNYLAGTSYVLSGASSVGEDLDAPWVQRGLAFLLAHQNPDGGFGEDVASYLDPTKAGLGASTPPQTGMVVAALAELALDGRMARREDVLDALARAVAYLLACRGDDGLWPNAGYLVPNIPPNNFYTYEGARMHLPLEALGRVRALAELD